jgi:hypothetical protein
MRVPFASVAGMGIATRFGMTPDRSCDPSDVASHPSSNAPASGTSHPGPPFAQRVTSRLSHWPSDLDAQLRRAPYAALGVAFAVGMGAGVLAGSRVLRSVLVSVASSALVAVAAGYVRSES